MNTVELNDFVKNLGISRDQILREEAELNFLKLLADNKLGAKVVFYGGTALRLAYGSPRFSEDIDLISVKYFKFTEFKKFIKEVGEANKEHWQVKDIKEKRNTMFALFLIRDKKLKHNFSLKIETRIPAKKVSLESQLALIKSPVSAKEPLLLVPTIRELKKMKENALAARKKARDIFDLWYIAQALREPFSLPDKMPIYSKREFKNELQVFLPIKYYPIIEQLYGQINKKT
ncbi:nucleotidyl transferase AbiEii/AbiGii toxin family protein [Patescibacteria group bacterium]|nr:nucleotidyl transferase AbiEii/AbiGii toxin family protein [Patescibacteria group bacterium]